jgi:hypothetical protein
MLMRPVWLSFAAVILLGAVGCSDDEEPATLDLTGNWLLVAATYEGHEYDFTSAPTAMPDANFVLIRWGETQANTGCRTAAVVVEVKGHDVSIAVPEVGWMMSCLPYVVDPMHGNYYEALENVESGSISGDELSLSGPDTTLTFRHAGSNGG